MEERIVHHQYGKDPLYRIWHASEEHLFMYIYSDGGSIVSGEKVFPIKKGALVFIAAGAYHYSMPDDPEHYERSKLSISPQRFSEIVKLLRGNTFFSLASNAIVYAEIDDRDQETVEAIFHEDRLWTTEEERELVLLSCCAKLLLLLKRYSIESTVSSTGFMGKAIDYINQYISFDISIDDICSAASISKHYFCRQFKRYMGMTVMEYILKTRIVLAKNDLIKTNMSVAEISAKNGFSSVSYFCRVFKQEEKITPLQYRKAFHIK